MNALDLLDRIAAAGLDIEPDGDRLIVGPRELLTNEFREAVRANRDALLELLRAKHWHWQVSLPDRAPFRVWVAPGADRAWMANVYPNALIQPLVRDTTAATATTGEVEARATR